MMSDNIIANLRRDRPLSWENRLEAADEIFRLREENARLREALRPFAEKAEDISPDDGSILGCLCSPTLLRSHFFAAAAAIREGGKDE